MSRVPPEEPQPSRAPPSLATPTHDEQSSSKKPSVFPTLKLRLELRDLSHPSTNLFLQNFNSAKDFADLVETVVHRLYTIQNPDHKHSDNDKDQDASPSATTIRPTPPSHTKTPGTRSVTLILRDMDGVAYTTGSDLDSDHKEIHLSLSYLNHVSSSSKNYPPRAEIMGVVCHELVHCFQWNALGSANGGLIEGIADWVRLNAGFIPPHWKKETRGKEWDNGYQTTGYFLDWIEKNKGKGSVFRLNQALADKEYDEESLWEGLFGSGVRKLWKEYAREVEKGEEESKVEGYGDPDKKMQIRIRKGSSGSQTGAE